MSDKKPYIQMDVRRMDALRETRAKDAAAMDVVTKALDAMSRKFSSLRFEPEGHRYTVGTKRGDIPLPSASSIAETFEEIRDWGAIAKKYAEKHGRKQEDVEEEWRYKKTLAANNGTSVHLFAEAMFDLATGKGDMVPAGVRHRLEGGWLLPCCGKEEAAISFWEQFLSDGWHPVAAEGRIHSLWVEPRLTDNYAGTFDLLAYRPGDGFALFDYKTNASLSDDHSRSHGRMLLQPFDNLTDEPLGLYAIQQSCYSLALRHIGIDIRQRNLVHLKDDGSYHLKSVPDMETQVRDALSGKYQKLKIERAFEYVKKTYPYTWKKLGGD